MTLKEKIAAAFTDVAQPADEAITRCPYQCFECTAVAGFFKGKKWPEITAADARHYHGALNVFTPEAFHYYVPAFMFASLDSNDRHDIIPDSIRYHFEFALEHREYFHIRMSKFSAAQKKVITEFLREMERRGAGSSEEAIDFLNEETHHA
ncbi:MAG TPA: DUF6714 family protein [Verrucomicrobiae bacterium]|jgi:hypothetical protein